MTKAQLDDFARRAKREALAGTYQPDNMNMLCAAIVARAYLDGYTNDKCSESITATERYEARQWLRENGLEWMEVLGIDIPMPKLGGGEA